MITSISLNPSIDRTLTVENFTAGGLNRVISKNDVAAGKGINVNAIAPGYMVTNNTEMIRNDPKRYDEILGRIPAGRWGMPSDMGGCAVFLSSAASDYVHGITIPVDGGWLAR